MMGIEDKKAYSTTSLLFASALVVALSPESSASVSATEKLDISGFINQGAVYTTDNQFFGDSENVSWRFHDVALGVIYKPSPRWLVSGQLKYRQAGEFTRDHVYIEHLFVDYRAYQTLSTQLGIRAGRIKNRYGLHNHVRDIAGSRPSILLSNAVYPSKQQDIGLASDAISLYAYGYLKDWSYTFDIVYGESSMSDQAEAEALVDPLKGSTDDQDALFGRLLIESPTGLLRLAYSQSSSGWDYYPDPGTSEVTLFPGYTVTVPRYGYQGEMEYEIRTLSAELNWGNWQLSAERSVTDYQFSDVYSPGYNYRASALGYYVTVSRQLSHYLVAFARWDKSYLNKNDRSGKRFASTFGSQRFWHYNHANVVGLKYTFNEHWSVAAEYHSIKGSAWLAASENAWEDTVRDWSMTIAQISYRF